MLELGKQASREDKTWDKKPERRGGMAEQLGCLLLLQRSWGFVLSTNMACGSSQFSLASVSEDLAPSSGSLDVRNAQGVHIYIKAKHMHT